MAFAHIFLVLSLCILSGHNTILTLDKRCVIEFLRRGDAKLAKHSDTSWKQDHPSTLFSNSVQRADRAVKQAMSHPQEIAVEHAFNSIEHAENALLNAIQHNEHLDTVEQNKELLEQAKKQLNDVKQIVEEQ